MTLNLDILLLKGERIASTDENLLLNEVNTSDFLGDRMFDLKTRVHFKEVEVLVLIYQELDCSSALVAARPSETNCLFSHKCTSLRVHEAGWCLFNNFLIASLNGALTLGHVYVVTVLVSQDLELDMAWLLNVLFDEDSTISEGRYSLLTRELKTLESFLIVEGDSHSLATTSSRGLNHHRIADII
jgi:hypothetical protein